MANKVYEKQFVKMIEDIFTSKQRFFRTFGGGLQTAYGAEYNDKFMELKTSPTDVVIQKYITDPNVAFEDGTGNSNRFGKRHEIKSIDETVGYDEPIAIHEGLDRFTINDKLDQVVAERATLHAQEWIEYLNGYMSRLLSSNAGKEFTTALTTDALTELFNTAYKYFINTKISNSLTWIAYVNADLYTLIIDHPLVTTGKNSAVNVDNQSIVMFKGFRLEVLPDEYFQEGEVVIFVPDNIGVIGLGLETYRVVESLDFNGVAIQGAAKTANYIPEKNKKAIVKAKVGA